MTTGFIKQRLANTVYQMAAARPARSSVELASTQNGPLVVAGLFGTASGLGEGARVCADALEEQGLSPLRCDLSSVFDQVDVLRPDSIDPFPTDPVGTLILHLNPPETPKGLVALGLRGTRRWRVVGYWVWETMTAPASWMRASSLVSEIWTPSDFSAGALRAVSDAPVAVVPHRVQCPASIESSALLASIPSNATVTLVMADGLSSFSRKNVIGAVRAFYDAVRDQPDCWLVVKVRNLSSDPSAAAELADMIGHHARTCLIDASVSAAEKWSILERSDIVLSPHRSEGFGLILAEAMALGKAVIATGWSGNMDFMASSAAHLLPYDLVAIGRNEYAYGGVAGQEWAEPDIAAASAAIRRLCSDPVVRSELGRNAQEAVKTLLSGRQYAEQLSIGSART